LNLFEKYQKIKHIFEKKTNILDFIRIKVVILFVLEQMFEERSQMSAQIIEFPMNRVRPVQEAVRTPGHYRTRPSARSAASTPVRPMALAKAILGWILIAIVSAGLLLGAGKSLQPAEASSTLTASTATSFEYVTIMGGDSLWSIAEQYAPDRDPRDFIAEIVALNNMSDSVVDAGMRIALPNN
jgi:LysM repeat protein